ncbi:protein of unknown function [Micromonospora eburnea]|uniref:DUF397 domain-containing protein n=1 Tax=Micromonospora eburnea TaxID=227316 RepID=A0A1C6U1A1_9ACTN|nr:protein of unknown function [Micromonospora eburnea]
MRRDGVWRKSSRSGGEGDCVEVAGFAEAVGVRDSKDRQGPVLSFDPASWARFVAATCADQFGGASSPSGAARDAAGRGLPEAGYSHMPHMEWIVGTGPSERQVTIM